MTDSSAYQRAIKEAEKIDPPALGLTNTTGITAVNGVRTIVKQNNVQLLLLAEIADRLNSLVEAQKQANRKEVKTTLPEDLIDKLQKLSIQDQGSSGSQQPRKVKEGKGILYGFKDPYVILAEEKAKLTPPSKKDESKGKTTASET
uniref:ORF2 n=1 Tax=Cacao swollen shoot virus TaxID=31559 RepID=A0A240FXH1_9VIRU|nr:ORF2 [Cacao swollen shoot virus]